MKVQSLFYLCPVCFQASESRRDCHSHPMVRCEVGEPDDERRKPLTDESGRLRSQAPRWFLEAVGWIPA